MSRVKCCFHVLDGANWPSVHQYRKNIGNYFLQYVLTLYFYCYNIYSVKQQKANRMFYQVTTVLDGAIFSDNDTKEVNSYIKAFRIAERWLRADPTKEALIYAVYEDDEDLESCQNIHKWASDDIREMQTLMAHLVFDEDIGGVTNA